MRRQICDKYVREQWDRSLTGALRNHEAGVQAPFLMICSSDDLTVGRGSPLTQSFILQTPAYSSLHQGCHSTNSEAWDTADMTAEVARLASSTLNGDMNGAAGPSSMPDWPGVLPSCLLPMSRWRVMP